MSHQTPPDASDLNGSEKTLATLLTASAGRLLGRRLRAAEVPQGVVDARTQQSGLALAELAIATARNTRPLPNGLSPEQCLVIAGDLATIVLREVWGDAMPSAVVIPIRPEPGDLN